MSRSVGGDESLAKDWKRSMYRYVPISKKVDLREDAGDTGGRVPRCVDWLSEK